MPLGQTELPKREAGERRLPFSCNFGGQNVNCLMRVHFSRRRKNTSVPREIKLLGHIERARPKKGSTEGGKNNVQLREIREMSSEAEIDLQEAAAHDESAAGGAGDGGAEGGGVPPGHRPPRHCHALPHLSHSEVRAEAG